MSFLLGADEIARGFLAIAVDNMANAIRKISVARGHDVTEYALACFGGAGGQQRGAPPDRRPQGGAPPPAHGRGAGKILGPGGGGGGSWRWRWLPLGCKSTRACPAGGLAGSPPCATACSAACSTSAV